MKTDEKLSDQETLKHIEELLKVFIRNTNVNLPSEYSEGYSRGVKMICDSVLEIIEKRKTLHDILAENK